MEGRWDVVYDDVTIRRGALLFLAACSGAEPGAPQHAASGSVPVPMPVTAPLVVSTPASAAPAPSPFPPGPAFDPDADPLLSEMPACEPLLAAARRGEWARVDAELAALADDPDAPVARYGVGVIALERGAFAVASRLLDPVASGATPLAPYAALRRAEAALGSSDAALARALLEKARPGVDARAWDEIALRAALGAREPDGVLDLLERIVARKDPGHRLLVLKHAKAGMVPPDATRASRVARLAQRAFLGAPSGRGADEAKRLVDFALGHLDRATRAEVTSTPPFDPVTVASELVATNRAREALRKLEKVPPSCEVLRVTADALGKVKRTNEAATTYGDAVDACGANAELAVPTLFAAGKAAVRGGLPDRAETWFGRVEAADPKHRLADDARLELALLAKKRGDGARFDALLARIDEQLPEGDMVGDALFELGLTRLESGDLARALDAFDRGARRGVEPVYTRTGRFSYFAGKTALRLGRVADAETRFARVFAERPVGYYATLSRAALESIAAGKGDAAFAAARAPDKLASAATPAPVSALGALPWLVRALDVQGATAEANRLGVESRSAHPFVTALAARLLARVDPARAHRLLRSADELDASPSRNEVRLHLGVAPEGAALALCRAAYPSPFAAPSREAAAAAGIDAPWVSAITREESAFDPAAVSRANAVGLMQLLVPTASKVARRRTSAADLKKPEENLTLGARFFAQLLRRYPGAPALAVAAYNAGPGNVDTWCEERPGTDLDVWVERIPFTETRGYVKRVLTSYVTYSFLAGGTFGDLSRPGMGGCPASVEKE